MLRYLADAYKALRQTVPDDAKTEELDDLIEWLGELVRQVDSSLLDEWETAAQPGEDAVEDGRPPLDAGPPAVTAQRARLPGAGAQRAVPPGRAGRAAPLRRAGRAGRARPAGTPSAGARRWSRTSTSTTSIGTGPDARGPQLLMIDRGAASRWRVRQIFDDPAGDHDWGISAEVDLAASDEEGAAVVRVTAVEPLGGL